MSKLRLNIGCINYRVHEDGVPYVHVDVHQHQLWREGVGVVELDVIADCRKLPYLNDSVDEVYTNQTLEHLGRFEYMDALNEFYRVLKPGGILDVAVPDIEAVCRQFIDKPQDRRALMQFFYGGQSFETDYHKTGFTSDILKEDLEKLSFKEFKKIEGEGLIRFQCIK